MENIVPFSGSVSDLEIQMRECEQTPGQDVLEHGLSVSRYFDDLRDHILEGKPLTYDWRLPDWIHLPTIWENLQPGSIIREYQIYHDCGKPFCRTIDTDGRVHFPCHELISGRLWEGIGGSSEAADLMRQDMDIHRMKADGVPEFAERSSSATLLLTGLAEVHSNASMFGGISSSSFKAKWKQIDRRGKAIAKIWMNKESVQKRNKSPKITNTLEKTP